MTNRNGPRSPTPTASSVTTRRSQRWLTVASSPLAASTPPAAAVGSVYFIEGGSAVSCIWLFCGASPLPRILAEDVLRRRCCTVARSAGLVCATSLARRREVEKLPAASLGKLRLFSLEHKCYAFSRTVGGAGHLLLRDHGSGRGGAPFTTGHRSHGW